MSQPQEPAISKSDLLAAIAAGNGIREIAAECRVADRTVMVELRQHGLVEVHRRRPFAGAPPPPPGRGRASQSGTVKSMATCPCGCGTKVGLMKRRVASKAVDVRMALPIVKRLKELGSSAFNERCGPADVLYRDGSVFVYSMLKFAHGDADEMTVRVMPSATELHDWQVRANFAAAAVNRHDPEFMASFIEVLSSKDQKLVRSMIKNADLRTQRGR